MLKKKKKACLGQCSTIAEKEGTWKAARLPLKILKHHSVLAIAPDSAPLPDRQERDCHKPFQKNLNQYERVKGTQREEVKDLMSYRNKLH